MNRLYFKQALHKQGKATADHTTLLLNCFTRLDKTDQVRNFVMNFRNPSYQIFIDFVHI